MHTVVAFEPPVFFGMDQEGVHVNCLLIFHILYVLCRIHKSIYEFGYWVQLNTMKTFFTK
jgi:hypothetical protein